MNSRSSARVIGSLVFGLSLTLIMGASTQAASWGPASASYDGSVRVQAWGYFTNENPNAKLTITLSDPSRDGNNAYAWGSIYSGTGLYTRTNEYSTGEYDYFGTPVTFEYTESLGGGRPAHSSAKACVQLGWPVPDRCSAWADATFNY